MRTLLVLLLLAAAPVAALAQATVTVEAVARVELGTALLEEAPDYTVEADTPGEWTLVLESPTEAVTVGSWRDGTEVRVAPGDGESVLTLIAGP